MTDDDQVFYQKGNVKVTESQLVICDEIYYIDTITSLSIKNAWRKGKKEINHRRRNCGIGMIIVTGILFILGVVLFNSSNFFAKGLGILMVMVVFLPGIFGMLLILTSEKSEPEAVYNLMLSSAASEKPVVSSTNQQAIEDMIEAINTAKMTG